jgi:hypothetical protein
MATTFIYALTDPDSSEVRYVGKSNHPTRCLYLHYREKAPTYKNRWLRSVRARGQEPVIRILEEIDEADWQERERYWIAFYRERGARLVNGTDGGDGVHGMRHSDEAKARIGEAARGNQYSRGRKPTPQETARRSAALRGRVVTEQTRAKIAATKTGRARSPEARAKLSAALKGRPISEAQRKARANRTLSDEHKAHIAEGLKAHRESLRAAQRRAARDAANPPAG